MRFLLSKHSRKILLDSLKKNYESSSFKELCAKMNLPLRTVQTWIYNEQRYIPEKIVPKELYKKLKILDKKPDNWGSVKGGKKTYKIIIKKYGIEEIRRRQSKGGKKSCQLRFIKTEPFELDLTNSLFLEFYGILLGDGWIGKYSYKNKTINLIGISGHTELDRNFFLYCKKNIKILFNRKAYLKSNRGNSIELNFAHKMFLRAINKKLNFPLGKKVNLKIHEKIYCLGYNYLKHVIRGIFDTDGSFYLDKTPVGNPYPCISIQMKAPVLIKQLYKILLKQGFRVIYREHKNMITLKGSIQLKKWMNEIGSSNPKHLNKINALVAQSG